MNINEVRLAGNLTRDPEIRYTPKGTAVAMVGLAINRRWKDTQTGEMKEDVTFVELDAFGNTAENLQKYFRKGQRIYIAGRLKLDTWEDKQTHQKRSKLGVVVESFQFVERHASAGGSGAAPAPSSGRPGSVSRPAASPPSASDQAPLPGTEAAPADDSEIPF